MSTISATDQMMYGDGAKQVRELGEYIASPGQNAPSWNVMFAGLAGPLTEQDCKQWADLGMHQCVELRETVDEPIHPMAAIHEELEYKLIPFTMKSQNYAQEDASDAPSSTVFSYIMLLEHAQQPIRQVMQLLAHNSEGTVIAADAAHHERLHIIAMLLLSIYGISTEQLVQREAMIPVAQELTAYLKEDYGDAEGYLRYIGISPREVMLLKARMLA